MIYLNKLLPLIVSPLVLTLLLVTIGTLTRRRWRMFFCQTIRSWGQIVMLRVSDRCSQVFRS